MLTIHTTCDGCGRELITNPHEDNNIHPGCTQPPPGPLDKLLEQFIEAATADRTEEANRLEAQIEALEGPPKLAAAAHWYAATCGWPVFPLRPGTKTPATPNGFRDATTDLDRIHRYWETNPQANIGIPTGRHFDVIDVDVPDGIPTYAALLNADIHIHGRAVTSSGGVHLLVEPTGQGNTVRADPGIDYRGDGGYIVAPPSWLGRRGTSWTWMNKPSPRIKQQATQ